MIKIQRKNYTRNTHLALRLVDGLNIYRRTPHVIKQFYGEFIYKCIIQCILIAWNPDAKSINDNIVLVIYFSFTQTHRNLMLRRKCDFLRLVFTTYKCSLRIKPDLATLL